MKSIGVLFWLAVLFVFSGAMMVFLVMRLMDRDGPGGVKEESIAISIPPGPITEFTLTERSGQEFDSTDLDDKVWLASFFYTRCPAECAQQNRKIQELQRDFSDKDVTFVSITCDPRYDTPAVLSAYAERFNADPEKWLFLTGDLEYIGQIGNTMFHVPVYDEKKRPTHAPYLIAVDRAGQLHYYTWSDPQNFAELKTKLNEFLEQTPEEARAAAEAELTGTTPEGDAEEVEAASEPAENEADPAADAEPATESAPAEEDGGEDTAETEGTAWVRLSRAHAA